ncbi:hypothetical protein [Salinibacter phage M31CR41-2]|uniref:Uncharacterized protein n=1 Tax=Salinibacter phage M31CR41-2 TaxID=2681614 RepID=A0A2I6UH58_9CAUD|nr:hypothetical protein FGG68_gp32 [Salinibacter phage M31CR41-2]AUO79323.1 hypothetical protein [Salinibacter phage M31CR41-2]AUO79393.1 hypothetical protein [Salinibacter virus M31CR41-3]
MIETTINFAHREPDVRVSIHTTSKRQADSIRARLEEFNAEYEEKTYPNGGGSTKFLVAPEDIRSPKGIIKASR